MLKRVINREATSKRIKELMQEHNLKADDIRHALNLESARGVYKWLDPNEKTMPSLDNLVTLADLFGCDVDDIIITDEFQTGGTDKNDF